MGGYGSSISSSALVTANANSLEIGDLPASFRRIERGLMPSIRASLDCPPGFSELQMVRRC